MTLGQHPRAGDDPSSAATPESGRRSAALAVERLDGVVVLRVDGELDMLTVPDLRADVHRATAATADSAECVVIDLTTVRFLSSSGLHLLISIHADLAAESRTLRVVTGPGRAVVRPLRITGLDGLLHLYPDLAAALAAGDGSRR
jgi:anti-sigma B factor antagonist